MGYLSSVLVTFRQLGAMNGAMNGVSQAHDGLSPKMAKILLFGRRGEYIHVYAMFFWVFIKRP